MIKLKEILTEAKELDSKIIKKMAALTDRNHHTEARIELAKALDTSLRKYVDMTNQ